MVPRTPTKSSSTAIDYPKGRVSAFTRVKNQMDDILKKEVVDKTLYEELLEVLQTKYDNFVSAGKDELSKENIDEEEMTQFQVWFEEKVQEMHNSLTCARKNLDELKEDNLRLGDSASVFHFDQRSTNSKASSTSSARIRLAERRAKLEAEQKLRDKKLLLQKQLEDLKFLQEKEEQNILEQELDKIDGKENRREIHNMLPLANGDPLNKCINFDSKLESENKYLSTKPKVPLNSVKSRDNSELFAEVLNKQNEISMSLVRNQQRALLPRHEPSVFDGKDPTSFNTFMCAFKRIIESHCDDDADKYYLLEKYTNG